MKKRWKSILLIGILSILLVPLGFIERKEVADESLGWNLILVNEDYYIPEDYEVELMTLDNGEKVDSRIYSALTEMFEAAKKGDVYMVVAAGYRTEKEQQALMDERVVEYQEKVLVRFVAEKLAEQWVAVPGTSEHQLGLAVDINADAINSSSTEVYTWLAEHAHEYGFIQRYPSDKTEITGISYEPWHYRYVGKEVAQEIFEEGICLEEYIDRIGEL